MNEDKNAVDGFLDSRNKLTEKEFNNVVSTLKPHLVAVATEFENVETPDERRLRLDDESDAARIKWMEGEIASLKAKRAERARTGFHIDPNRYYARKDELYPPPKPPPKIEIDRAALDAAIATAKCPVSDKICRTLDALSDDELGMLAIEIKRQVEDDGKRLREDVNSYNKIDWDKVAEEYDKQNPT